MISKSKTTSVVASIVGMTMAVSMFVGLGAQTAGAQATTIADLIALLVATGVIPADKAAAALAAAGGTTTTVTTGSTGGYNFTVDLTIGSKGADVVALQDILVAGGYLVMPAGVAKGYFGSLTRSAVSAWQAAAGISPAAGYVGPKSRAALNAMSSSSTTTTTTTTTPVVTTTNAIAVTLAATSPAAGAVVSGQAIANLGEFTFTNTSAAPVVVTNVSLKRMGVSNDAALSNVYLYNGVTRLTDSATISSGNVTFNAPAGLFTIPAGSSMTVAVRSDITAGSTYNGQIISMSLVSVTAGAAVVTGTFPISAANMTISSATLATVVLATSSPSTNTDLAPQNDFVMFQGTLTVNNNDVWMKSIALRQIGSVATADLSNFKLYADGNLLGSVMSLDANGYLTFNLSAAPYKLTTGSHVIKLIGDVVGGSTRTFSFSIRQASDINVVDSQLNVNVLATGSVGNFPQTAGVQTISSGSISIIKKTDSPAGNVVLAGNNITLAKFEIKASGEAVKIENLLVKAVPGNDVTVGSLRNGALYVNGAQIGSTNSISSSSAGTQFNLGSSLVVYPGTPVTVEVRADMYDDNGSNNLTAGDTLTVSLVAGSQNFQRMTSLSYGSTSAVGANQVTVVQGGLSLSKYSAYANQTVIIPQTARKIGEFTLLANSNESINLNTIEVGLSNSSTTNASTDVTDLYVVYGSQTTPVRSTVAAGPGAASSSFSVNTVLTTGQTMNIAVYANLNTGMLSNDNIKVAMTVSGQTVQSVQTITAGAGVVGQTMSVGTGTLALDKDASSPSTANVVPGSEVKVGSFKFTATNDSFTVTKIAVQVSALASAGNVSSITLKSGSTVLNSFPASLDTSDGSNAIATTTGLTLSVGANTTKVVDVYLNLSDVGTPGFATSSSNVAVTISGYEALNSVGTLAYGASATAANGIFVFKAVPSVTLATLPTTLLTNGTQTLAKVNISGPAAGSVAWSKIAWTLSKTATLGLSSLQMVDGDGTTIAGLFSTTTDIASTTAGVTGSTITFIPTTEEQSGMSSTKTYSVKAVVAGAVADSSVSMALVESASSHSGSTASSSVSGSFVWSDMSVSGHSATTADWNNGYLIIKSPNSDSQTLTF